MKTHLVITAAVFGMATGISPAQERPEQPPQPPAPPQQSQTPPPQPPPPAQQQAVDVSDTQLQKFAQIYVDVADIRDSLSGDLNQAENQQEAQQIQTRMRDQIISVIEDHGWSLDQYNRIANTISNNPELRNEALQLIDNLSS